MRNRPTPNYKNLEAESHDCSSLLEVPEGKVIPAVLLLKSSEPRDKVCPTNATRPSATLHCRDRAAQGRAGQAARLGPNRPPAVPPAQSANIGRERGESNSLCLLCLTRGDRQHCGPVTFRKAASPPQPRWGTLGDPLNLFVLQFRSHPRPRRPPPTTAAPRCHPT